MTDTEVIAKKQTTKALVWLKTACGCILEVVLDVAILCGTICNEFHSGRGCCMDDPISLPPAIKPHLLDFVISYCQYRHVSGSTCKNNAFDEKLLGMDANLLCELIYVAHYLQMKSLIDRTCEIMVKKLENFSSVEELRHVLKCPDNVTKEEKLSWIKILNKLILEKIEEKTKEKNIMKSAVVTKPRHHEDTRSIDDLLAFIEGGNRDSKGVQTCEKKKKKKKKSKKWDTQKNEASPCSASSSHKASVINKVLEDPDEISTQVESPDEISTQVEGPDEISTQDLNASEVTSTGFQSTCSISTMVADKLNLSNTWDLSFIFEDDFNDGDFDPSPSEEIDREVKDFALRLMGMGPDTSTSQIKGKDHPHK